MWRRSPKFLAVTSLTLNSVSGMTPLDMFTQVQLGGIPQLSQTRTFLLQHFQEELSKKHISEAKVMSLDHRNAAKLLKQMLYDRYLSLPFRCFSFDIEFTGLPRFTADAATADIVEMAFYHPDSGESFSTLVKPLQGYKMTEEAEKITGISDAMLEAEGKPFTTAWQETMDFLTRNRGPEVEQPGSGDNILLLSHGGKLSDVSMLQRSTGLIGEEIPRYFEFGDTFNIMRDLHRKRPVTKDKLPPSWRLEDVATWLNLDISKVITGESHQNYATHRAAGDAKLTWASLIHTLDRYGDDTLTPQQQLVARFYDTAARRQRQQDEAIRRQIEARNTTTTLDEAISQASEEFRGGALPSGGVLNDTMPTLDFQALEEAAEKEALEKERKNKADEEEEQGERDIDGTIGLEEEALKAKAPATEAGEEITFDAGDFELTTAATEEEKEEGTSPTMMAGDGEISSPSNLVGSDIEKEEEGTVNSSSSTSEYHSDQKSTKKSSSGKTTKAPVSKKQSPAKTLKKKSPPKKVAGSTKGTGEKKKKKSTAVANF